MRSDTMATMTTKENMQRDADMAHKRFDHGYGHEAVENAIHGLRAMGYTRVAPFISEHHIQTCSQITSAVAELEDKLGITVSDDKIASLCVLGLSRPKHLTDILSIIRDRHITSSHEASQILKVMQKVTESID